MGKVSLAETKHKKRRSHMCYLALCVILLSLNEYVGVHVVKQIQRKQQVSLS